MPPEPPDPAAPEPSVPQPHTLSLTLARSTADRLKEIATAQQRTFTGQIRFAIQEHIARVDAADADDLRAAA